MKNTLVYYISILSPLFGLIWLSQNDWINSNIFLISILFYVLVYRNWTDGQRLYEKGEIEKKDIWRKFHTHKFSNYKALYWID